MANLSFSVEFVWQYAGNEALRCGSEYIEPEHLLIGICSLEDLFSTDLAYRMKLSSFSLAGIRAEWQELLNLLTAAGISPGAVRATVRGTLKTPTVGDRPESRHVSRSAASHAIFGRAAELAQAAGSSMIGVLYLFAALTESTALAEHMPTSSDGQNVKALAAAAAAKPLHSAKLPREGAHISEYPLVDRRKKP
jgi:hypothetical protein